MHMGSAWIQRGGYAGTAAAFVFVLSFGIAVSLFAGYDVRITYLSDLGVGGASALAFNAGLIIAGLLGTVFGYGLLHEM